MTEAPSPAFHAYSSPSLRHRSWGVLAVFASLLLLAALYGAGRYGTNAAMEALLVQAHTDANLKSALLRAVLERPRALPLLLAEDQQLMAALLNRDRHEIETLDVKLERLVAGTNASVLYVIDRNGVAIASSNWREPLSFVGNDYSFRDYFSRAMREGAAEHFALGNVSKRPGLYISRRVDGPQGPLGVVVVKMEFDQLENDWRDADRPVYVADPDGIVLITSIASWRFMTSDPIAPERLADIRRSLQFGDAAIAPLPLTQAQALGPGAMLVSAVLPGARTDRFLRLVTPVDSTDWRLNYLLPVEPAVAAARREAQLLVLALFLPLLGLAAILLWRRQAAVLRIASEREARTELARRVAERTADLSQARDRLEAEIADHRSTEAKLQVVQQELVQANRLAILGQVAAGVAHEINQPVATIRAYADNARVFLARAQTAAAEDNLGEIAALTERIGMITDDLKAFGRKGRSPPQAVALRAAIEGAVVLLRSRFAGRLDALSIALPPAGLAVTANRVRLEQVLINLFQNALEALEGRSDARVEVRIEDKGERVAIRIADNGPGISPAIMDALFKPFNTSKEKGLGLGLVIVKDIVSDYDGRIDVESDENGTTFIIDLPKAEL